MDWPIVGLGRWDIPTYWGRDRRIGLGGLSGLNYRDAVLEYSSAIDILADCIAQAD